VSAKNDTLGFANIAESNNCRLEVKSITLSHLEFDAGYQNNIYCR
jgi:hypothetical protein